MKNVVKKQHGFTLLELVVVVAVLGLIASMATEFVAYETNQSRYDLTKERRNNIRSAMVKYYGDCSDKFPAQLKDLIVEPASGCTAPEWKGPYIADVDFESGIPVYRDGWGNASGANASLDVNFGWTYQGNSTAASVAVVSLGLDAKDGTPVSASGSKEYNFEEDYGRDYPLLTIDQLTASTGSYQLRSVAVSGASPAYSVLTCYSSASAGATSVSMSFCMQ